MYLGTDAIADRDLGFAIARRAHPSGAGSILTRTETSTSLLTPSQGNTSGTAAAPSTVQQGPNKRAASPPEHRKRDESRTGGAPGGGSGEYSSGHKRARPQSPPVRDRETRWGRRDVPAVPAWDREERGGRGRDGGPRGGQGRDFEEEKGRHVQLPGVVSWFIGELPTPASFDGTRWLRIH